MPGPFHRRPACLWGLRLLTPAVEGGPEKRVLCFDQLLALPRSNLRPEIKKPNLSTLKTTCSGETSLPKTWLVFMYPKSGLVTSRTWGQRVIPTIFPDPGWKEATRALGAGRQSAGGVEGGVEAPGRSWSCGAVTQLRPPAPAGGGGLCRALPWEPSTNRGCLLHATGHCSSPTVELTSLGSGDIPWVAGSAVHPLAGSWAARVEGITSMFLSG